MHIDSLRDLKHELVEAVAMPAGLDLILGDQVHAAAVGGALAAGEALPLSHRMDAAHVRPAGATSYALGVRAGAGKGDFHLGVRLHVGGEHAARFHKHFTDRSKGECHVRVVPRLRKRAPPPPVTFFRARQRPLQAGLSVGHHLIRAGSLGLVVQDGPDLAILSNNHVLAAVNRGQPGDPILQPARMDLSGPPDATTPVAVLDRYVPLSFQRANLVDAALAHLLPQVDCDERFTCALPGLVTGVEGVGVEDLGRQVLKAGRSTGVSRGTITLVEVDRLRVDMTDPGEAPQQALFSDQFEVEGEDGNPFSMEGDSGSLVVDADGKARGLLFAGGADEKDGTDVTYCNRIDHVLTKLGVTLAK